MLDDFLFLRPAWLLALLPLPLLLWHLRRYVSAAADWQGACDAHLLPHLLVNMGQRRSRLPLVLLALGWVLAVVALAGPAWEKLPQPVFKAAAARVLVLDLSRSMDAADLPPSRLQQARFKLRDLLERSKEGETALLVYAGDVHVVSPLTSDAATIANLVPSLTTDLMPRQGSRADLALQKAAQLLRQAGVQQGEVILFTDGAGGADTRAAAEALQAAGHRLSVLGFGTAAGAPIPLPDGGYQKDAEGGIVMPRLDSAELQRLAQAGGGIYSPWRTDDGDLNRLPGSTDTLARAQESQPQDQQLSDAWREEGPWLLLPLLLLAALSFRRGWLALLLLLPLPWPQPAQAGLWDDLWQRPDQQATQAFQQQQYQQAAQQFQSPEWQGSAHYRAGDYAKAAAAFAQSDTARAHYNRGNALAQMGRLEEAEAAYQQALERQPDYPAAQENLELAQQLKQQQEQQQQSGEDGQEGEQGEQGQDEENSSGGEQQNSEQGENSQSGEQNQQQDQQQGQGQEGDANQQQAGDNGEQPGQSQDAESADSAAPQQAESGAPDEQEPQQQQQNAASQPEETEQAAAEEAAAAQAADADADAEENGTENAQAMSAAEAEMSEEEREQAQALQSWLSRVPDDPGGLLRRKFAWEAEMLRRQQGRQAADAEREGW